MSSLLSAALSDDERSTLEAALAFIDSNFDAAAAKRARNVQAAARSNRKRRAELLQLRELARELEATHGALLAARRTGHVARRLRGAGATRSSGDADGRAALALATAESLRLSESRALNRRLRAALDQQRDVGAALVQVLRRRLELKCVQDLLKETTLSSSSSSSSTAITVSDESRHVAAGWSTVRDRKSLFMDLNARLQAFAVETNSALAARAGELVLSESRTRAYRHAKLGPVMELVSSTHVPCGLDEGWRHMMGSFCTGRGHADDLGYRAQIRPNPELGVSEKEYALELQDQVRDGVGRLSVEGFGLFDLYESGDWKLFIWASVAGVRGDGPQVRERGWTAMTRSPMGGCALHRLYELYTANASACALRDLPCAKTKLLAESLLQKARQDGARLENAMAARFGSDASNVAALFGSGL